MNEPTLYINGRFLTQPMTGTNRFAYELCLQLAERKYDFLILTPKVPLCEEYDVSRLPILSVGHFSSHIWEQISLPLFLRKRRSMLLSMKGLGPVFKRNQICTIHDMSYLANPGWFSKGYYYFYRMMTPIMAKHAKRILTVSHFSKGEISSRLGISPDKISVVYNAPAKQFSSTSEYTDSTEKYYLTVSSLDPRKNLSLVFSSYLKSSQKYPLYVIGEKHSVFGDVTLPENSQIRFLGRVSDEELCRYYAGCSLFVYPSLYEGFGMPPMEAIACGCRQVVLSDIPVFREVYGEVAHYVKVDDEAALSHLFDQSDVPTDTVDFADFIEKYSWRRSVEQLLEAVSLASK